MKRKIMLTHILFPVEMKYVSLPITGQPDLQIQQTFLLTFTC